MEERRRAETIRERSLGAQSSMKMETSGVQNDLKDSQDYNMNCNLRDKTNEELVEFFRDIIAGKDKKINELEESLIRKHAEEGKDRHIHSSVDKSTQTVLLPVPPREGTPRRSTTRPHRRIRTVPLSVDDMLRYSLFKLTPLQDFCTKPPPSERNLPPVDINHVTTSKDPEETASRLNRPKESRRPGLNCLSLPPNDPTDGLAVKEHLPPITPAETVTS